MNEDHSQFTRWALGEMIPGEAATFEAALAPMQRSDAEAHRDFCERAAGALAQERRGLPAHKRAAILAAFAVREAAVHRRRAHFLRLQQAAQAVLALCFVCGLGWILSQIPRRPFASHTGALPSTVLSEAVSPGELEVANYRLATLTAYLESAEARLRAAELTQSPRIPREEGKPAAPPSAKPPPKPAPEARLLPPFADSFQLAQVPYSL